jgi:NADPH:quinone reductase-like Zn-dependent oxidoreductase
MGGQQIHAAVLHAVGQTPRYELFPAPVAGDGEAVVTVTAAALKPSDRWMANGVHYAPTTFPQVAGLDGVGRLADGSRVAFLPPVRPYGGMAEQTLVRDGMWLPVPDGVDDVTAAAFLNPGMAAWKTIMWEGELAAGQTVLVLGATGASGRIATQLAKRRGARVVAAGRSQRVLGQLVARGADAVIRVDRPRDELAAAIAAEGPYHLIVDYLWGAPAEAVFAALVQSGRRAGAAAPRTRYVLTGMSAGEVAGLPALTLRAAPVQLVGSGFDGPAGLAEAAAAYDSLLQQAAAGEISSISTPCRSSVSRRPGDRPEATAGSSSSPDAAARDAMSAPGLGLRLEVSAEPRWNTARRYVHRRNVVATPGPRGGPPTASAAVALGPRVAPRAGHGRHSRPASPGRRAPGAPVS